MEFLLFIHTNIYNLSLAFHFSGYNVNKRHDFLWNSIGYLKEEQDAVETIRILMGFSFGYMIIGHILQAYFFYLYNQKFHPFGDILRNDYCNNLVEQELSIIPNESSLNGEFICICKMMLYASNFTNKVKFYYI